MDLDEQELEATRNKSADKMFEELGYKEVSNKRYLILHKEVEFTQGSVIDSITIDWGMCGRFKKERLEMGMSRTTTSPEYITEKEFNAISEKLKERTKSNK